VEPETEHGSFYAKFQQGNTVYSHPTRVTTPPTDVIFSTDYKGGGSNRLKFEYRPVNYPNTPVGCQGSTGFNPLTHNWDNPSVPTAFILNDNRALPESPSAWAVSSWTANTLGPGGFALNEGIDIRVQAWSESGGDLFIDNLEVR